MGSIVTKSKIDNIVRKSMRPYKKRDITVRFIPNILSDEGRILKSYKYNRDYTIRRYLKKSGFEFKDMMIAVNGKECLDLKKHLTVGDEIVIAPKVEDPVTAIIAAVWTAIAAHPFIAAAVAVTLGYSIYSAISAGAVKIPTYDTSSDSFDEGSAASTWDGCRTTNSVGTPIPVIYGERVIGGNVLNEYVSTDGDNNYLHTLLGIGWGELESIAMRRINKNTATNYSGWELTTRMGTLDQEVLPNFHDSHNLVSIGIELTKDNAYTYTTADSDVEAFELQLTIPGLYQQDSSGNILSWGIAYKVEYKLHTDSTWIDLGSTTISERTRNQFKRIYRKDGLTAGQYDIRITRTSDDPSDLDYPITNGELWLERIDEISCEDEQIFPRVALAAIDALALEQLSGSFPEYELLIKGRKIMTPNVLNDETPVPWDDYYWDPEEGKYRLLEDDTILTWDGETFVTAYSANPVWCLYDLQTNKLFGAGNYITEADNDIDSLIEQSQYCEERVSDGKGGYEKRFRMDVVIDTQSKALDLMLQLATIFRAYPFYSDKGQVKLIVEKPETPVALFSPGNIIEDSFSESWGSKRNIYNIVNVQYDDEENNYETQTVQAVVDDASLIAGNPPNPITIRYYGVKESYAIRFGRDYFKAMKYITNTITLSSALGSMIRQCGEVVDIAHDVPQWGFGGTVKGAVYKGDYSAAITYAVNEAVTYEDNEYKCIVASLNHLPTDTDYWQIISRTKVFLDRTVEIEADKSYAIRVDFARGGYEERTVIDAAGSYTEVNVSEAFSKTPLYYDVYSFGEVDKVVKEGRIMGISRNRNGEIDFTIPEYNENIYDDSAVILSTKKVSSLSTDFPDVEDLTLSETVITKTDGTIENAIEVSFALPDMSSYIFNTYKKAKIYYSDNGGTSWIYAGETAGTEFIISNNIKVGLEYTVAVVSVGLDSRENLVADSPQEMITLEGKTTPPADVQNFAYTFEKELVLKWDKNSEEDFAGYEIRMSDENWGQGDVTVTVYLVTEDENFTLMTEDDNYLIPEQGEATDYLVYKGFATTLTIAAPTSRTPGTFYIKAFDTSGNYSVNAVSVTPTNAAPEAPSIAATQWFGYAKIEWTDVNDTDLKYYEVYKSTTNAWTGEEALDVKTPGRSATVQGNAPVDAAADSADSDSITDADLIGQGEDVFVGDRLVQTSGTHDGQEATITAFNNETGKVTVGAWPDGTPDAGDEFTIKDRAYYKVRAVDAYGPGEFSSAVTIDFTPLAEAEIGDAIISARKLIAGEVITLSAQIKDAIITSAKILGLDAEKINVGTLTGFTIQTAASGSRVLLTPNSLVGYDDSGNKVLEVLLTGTDVGDVIIGDYAGGKGIKWDKSAGTFGVKGAITATSGNFTGTVNIGTAGKVFIDGANEVIKVYDADSNLRVELGKLS